MEWISRELLIRYIMLVIDAEGLSFLEWVSVDDDWGSVRLSQAEIDQLREAESEARRRLSEVEPV